MKRRKTGPKAPRHPLADGRHKYGPADRYTRATTRRKVRESRAQAEERKATLLEWYQARVEWDRHDTKRGHPSSNPVEEWSLVEAMKAFTYPEMAHAIGCSSVSIGQWLRGEVEPLFGYGVRLALFLGVEVDELCFYLEARRSKRRIAKRKEKERWGMASD